MSVIRVPAPAKVNLFLKVLNKREDGYHNLQTLFHFLDLNDFLEFKLIPGEEGIMLDAGLAGVDEKENLIFKAASQLKIHARQQGRSSPLSAQGVRIKLKKNIPMGAGLGGGSSDAASTLLTLNRLWQLGFSLDELAKLGLALGSDVPVFVRGESALAEGRGELLTPMKVPEYYYLVIKPSCHVSTAEVFGHRELTRDSSPRTIRAFLRGGERNFQSFQRLEELIKQGNDCQALVRKLYPEIDQSIALLDDFAHAQLTGTGACVFAAFETQDSAENAYRFLQEKSESLNNAQQKKNPVIEKIMLVKGKNISPVHQLLSY